MIHYMKSPCEYCPFRHDVKPFLHPERGVELAHHAQNQYNSFSCHKTTVEDEDSEDGKMLVTHNSKECAGFLSMQISENGDGYCPKGFTPSPLAYGCADDMIYAYEELNDNE